MRIVQMNIRNFKSLKDVQIPLYRELTQVFVPERGDNWDFTMAFDAIPLAIKNGWKSMSNVLTERMDESSRIEMIIRDEDEQNLIDNYPVPTHYKIAMCKIGPHYSCDIGIDYYRSVNGDTEDATWEAYDPGKGMLNKFKEMCEDIIWDEETALQHIGGGILPEYYPNKFDHYHAHEDFGRLLPWYCLSNEELNGRHFFIKEPYFCVSQDGIDNFQRYLHCNKEGKFVMLMVTKMNELDMNTRTTVIHKGKSYEFPYECFESDKERREAYQKYLYEIMLKD